MIEPLNTAEMMALAVLRRDKDSLHAARQLADLLLENVSDGRYHLLPVTKLSVSEGDVNALVYIDGKTIENDADIDAVGIKQEVSHWLRNGGHCILVGVERIELYQFKPTGPRTKK